MNQANLSRSPIPITAVASLGAPAASHHAQLVKQTQKWVAQTFYGTLLRQMRKSPFHSDLFEGGRGGEAFQQVYDQHLADHMSRGTGRKLVDSIVRRIEAKRAYAKSGAGREHSREFRSDHVPAGFRA